MPLQPAVASTAPGVGGRTLPDRLAAQTDTLLAKALAGVRNAQRPATSVTHAPTDPETAEGPPEKRRRTCVSGASIAAARAWRALGPTEKAETTMDAFAKHHQCTGQSIRRYVTYGGDYKEAMRPYLECGEVLSSASAAAPPPSLAEARKDYLRQHPEPSASDFLKFASAKGVRRFSGVNQLISGSEFVSQKPRAAVPGTTPEDNAARLAEHGGRVATSDCRIAAEAWNKLDPKTRAITDRAAFARKFGVTYQGMGRYVEFDGAYTQKMLDILKKESGGASGTSAERPPASQAGRVVQDPWIGEEPMHASATQAQNLAEETGHEVIAPAALAPPMPMQSATTDHLDLTEDEWATIPAVLEDATEEQWAMLQAALHEARSQSPSRP